jgi:hypothetical protein
LVVVGVVVELCVLGGGGCWLTGCSCKPLPLGEVSTIALPDPLEIVPGTSIAIVCNAISMINTAISSSLPTKQATTQISSERRRQGGLAVVCRGDDIN